MAVVHSCAAPPGSKRCGLPCEPVRVGEGPGIAANHEPVRSGAFGRDAGVLGKGTVPVECQLADIVDWVSTA
jgi:hypothetical protein